VGLLVEKPCWGQATSGTVGGAALPGPGNKLDCWWKKPCQGLATRRTDGGKTFPGACHRVAKKSCLGLAVMVVIFNEVVHGILL